MLTSTLVGQLLAAGLAEDFAAVAALPGAGHHAQVLGFVTSLRREFPHVLDRMTATERTAFIKALAVYEDTVNGLGSVTALCQLLPLIPGGDEATIDWVLSQTRSYDHYAGGARSLAAVVEARDGHASRKASTARLEAERERAAKKKRAARATTLLYNAVRRGDLKAVQGLIAQGASPMARTPDGEDLEDYAQRLGRPEIATLLREAGHEQ